MTYLSADLLIPGSGDPVTDAVVVMAEGTIRYAGPRSDAPAPASSDDVLHVPVVMPGMWDCHTHLVGTRAGFGLDTVLLTPPAVAAARSVGDLAAALRAGITSVRELGGHGPELAQAVTEGSVTGPDVYAAGAAISPTGGHGDAHRVPYPWVRDCAAHGGILQTADGVDECLRAVRLQLRRGARVIKVCASGGVISDLDHPLHRQFSPAELRAVVEEAQRADRIVAAHCHGRDGIMAALAAGCGTIEHGSCLDEEAASLMREQDAVLVPTRTIFEGILAERHLLNEESYAKAAAMADRHLEAIAIAHRAGVRIAAGTDLGTSRPGTPLSWGRNGMEAGHLVAAGLTPLEAIEACTANGPLTLGPQAPKSGQLAAGYQADVLALSADPLSDITVLGDPRRITHVWKHGELVKHPTPLGSGV
ncbi:metal-dependent hydrolase family protein [Streptomyces sp. NPDC054933]